MEFTLKEARRLMLQGLKVRHRLFSDGEYITMDVAGNVVTTEGYGVTWAEFFRYRSGVEWTMGWEIFIERSSNIDVLTDN